MKKIEGYKSDSYDISGAGYLEWNTRSGFEFEIGDSIIFNDIQSFSLSDFVVSQCFDKGSYMVISGKIANNVDGVFVDDSMIVSNGVVVSSVGFPFLSGISIDVRATIETNMNYINQVTDESEDNSETEETIIEGEKEIYGDSEDGNAETENV